MKTGYSATPQREFGPTILQILVEKGGSAYAAEVIQPVGLRWPLTEGDNAPNSSGRREPQWKNNVRYAKKHLVDDGLIEPCEESGNGIWTITDRGRLRAESK